MNCKLCCTVVYIRKSYILAPSCLLFFIVGFNICIYVVQYVPSSVSHVELLKMGKAEYKYFN